MSWLSPSEPTSGSALIDHQTTHETHTSGIFKIISRKTISQIKGRIVRKGGAVV
jgi:hypothetical protein